MKIQDTARTVFYGMFPSWLEDPSEFMLVSVENLDAAEEGFEDYLPKSLDTIIYAKVFEPASAAVGECYGMLINVRIWNRHMAMQQP